MLPKAFVKGDDRRRLRNVLLALFVAISIPIGVVIWQAFDQLKWESWYQYRTQAESLTARINAELSEAAAAADARGFADYSFITSSTASNVVQRSPLSTYPVEQDVAGTMGYFQIGPDGQFSTPLLPPETLTPEQAGLGTEDILARQLSAGYITQILADNALVSARATGAGRSQDDTSIEEIIVSGSRLEAATAEAVAENYSTDASSVGALNTSADPMRDDSPANSPADWSFEQRAFDQLDEVEISALARKETDGDEPETEPARASSLGKVQDLQLDDALEKKNEELMRQEDISAPSPTDRLIRQRARRSEPAPASMAPPEPASEAESPAVITTFESEIDPFEFSMLDSGHLVLYRDAWQDNARFIQGLLLDQEDFLQRTIEAPYLPEPLADMSTLIVSYEDDIIDLFSNADDAYSASIDQSELRGALLYRSRLAAPFERLELIFSIEHLPPGPGAQLLVWLTALIAIVFVGGFFALYRLGIGQIRLARQQQDFVSAVSHELKTPLTSIRMYGEMLKEGWADEEKQKQYYEYIHDESERLSRMISNVLQLAKITRSEPQFDPKTVTVSELMDQVRSKIASQAESAGFDVVISLDEETGIRTIEIDEDCFAQIVINLVDNAIKFSKDANRRQIDIGGTTDRDGKVLFSVRDYGPGIPKDQLRKIFQLFYRTETELTRETVGTGIGLAIVHQLTTAMHGSVDVINRDPGAVFQIRFPSSP